MGRPSAKSKLVKTLRRLQRERDRRALLNWFAMGARNLLRGVLPGNKITQRFIQSHRQELSVIADKKANEEESKKTILKRGGAGFLGGTIIRHLFKWDTGRKGRQPKKTKKPRVKKAKKTAGKKRVLPAWMVNLAKKKQKKAKKTPPRIPKLILHKKTAGPKTSVLPPSLLRRAKYPKTKKKKKTPHRVKNPFPNWAPKKLVVKLPFLAQTTPPKATKTLADLKAGLAQKKMERAMRGPIGSSRTSDTALPRFANGGMKFQPLSTSTPVQAQKKYKCKFCPLVFNARENRNRHEETVHHKRFDPKHPSAIVLD